MISLLLVNYRSASLAIDAIQSARAATAFALQVVVVENSADAAEADRLRASADVLVTPPTNLGYAGGINAGRPHCTGDVIIISNPDVIFSPGSIDELIHAMTDRNAAVAGPALYWDNAHSWMLPPSELHTATEKLDEALATRSRWWAQARDRRRMAGRLWFWSLQDAVQSRAISGAIMAVRAADLDAAGGFDERFPLYFEENDFLRRIASDRKRILYVPTARCRHLYNQSAGDERARAALIYAESEMRYLTKWYGATVARFLKRIERAANPPSHSRIDGPVPVPAGDVFIEASPLPSFETAAGHFPATRNVDVPPEVWSSYRSEELYFRVVDRKSLLVLATYARYRT
jgi:N-acetylglucosaminyl-diphospho-decaprenol L-rhamnosyltransferase